MAGIMDKKRSKMLSEVLIVDSSQRVMKVRQLKAVHNWGQTYADNSL